MANSISKMRKLFLLLFLSTKKKYLLWLPLPPSHKRQMKPPVSSHAPVKNPFLPSRNAFQPASLRAMHKKSLHFVLFLHLSHLFTILSIVMWIFID